MWLTCGFTVGTITWPWSTDQPDTGLFRKLNAATDLEPALDDTTTELNNIPDTSATAVETGVESPVLVLNTLERPRSLDKSSSAFCDQYTGDILDGEYERWAPSPSSRQHPAYKGTNSPDYPPIAAEDLAKLGIELRLIPFIVSIIPWDEKPLSSTPPLSPGEAENLVETLDKVRGRYPQIPVLSAKTPHDQVVSSPTVNPSLKNRCFRLLRDVSYAHAILPKSYYPEGVTLNNAIHCTSNGFADIWKGRRGGNQVCVKAFRIKKPWNLENIKVVRGGISIRGSSADDNQRLYREIIGWKYVSHPNVLPFHGVSETLFPFCIISPWLSNGNIIEYIKKNQRANRLQLVSDLHDPHR